MKLTRRGKDLIGLLALHAVAAIGFYVSLGGIHLSQSALAHDTNPTPLGYFRSLALFALPCLVFGTWIICFRNDLGRRLAFGITILLLVPLGVLLDLFFGKHFFVFPNTGAVLGSRIPWLRLPAYDWSFGFGGLLGPGWVKGYIPIEEMLFYALGFTAILLTYVWCEAILFGDGAADPCQPVPRLFRRWWSAAGTWVVMGGFFFLVAYAVAKTRQPPGQSWFPGYFLFLIVSAFLPCAICFRVAFHFVHWRALTVAWLFVLSISQFWEGSLGLPYQWWDYNHAQMMGLFIRPLCDLPIEAILVWSLASWTTAVVYETIRAAIRLHRLHHAGYSRVLRAETPDLAALKYRSGPNPILPNPSGDPLAAP